MEALATQEGTRLKELHPVFGQAEMLQLMVREQRGTAQDPDSVVISSFLSFPTYLYVYILYPVFMPLVMNPQCSHSKSSWYPYLFLCHTKPVSFCNHQGKKKKRSNSAHFPTYATLCPHSVESFREAPHSTSRDRLFFMMSLQMQILC